MSLRPELPDISSGFPFDAEPAQTMATFDGSTSKRPTWPGLPFPNIDRLPGRRYRRRCQRSSHRSALTPYINPQVVAPISAVPNSLTMGPSQLPTFNQSPTQSPDFERRRLQRPATMGLSTLKGAGTSRSVLTLAQSHSSQYTEMVIESVESVSFRCTILSCFLHWVILAGFLILPTTFDDLQKIAVNSSAFDKALHAMRHIP